MQPNQPTQYPAGYQFPPQESPDPRLELDKRPSDDDLEQTATDKPADSHKVGDLVNVDTLDPVTGAPLVGVGLVTAVHEADEDGGEAGYTVALLPTFGFRVTADQLT